MNRLKFSLALVSLLVSSVGCTEKVAPPTMEEGPIRLAVIIPLAIPGAVVVTNSVSLAVQQFNANGGVRGREVEVVFLEEGMRPSTARDAARVAIEEEQVHGIIGPFFPTNGLAVAEIAYARNVPHIAFYGAEMASWEMQQDPSDRVSFGLTAPAHLVMVAAVQGWLREPGVCSSGVAILHDEVIDEELALPEVIDALEQEGHDFQGAFLLRTDFASYTSQLEQVKNETTADCMLTSLDGDAMARVLRDWESVGGREVSWFLSRDVQWEESLAGLPGASMDVRTPGSDSWLEFERAYSASYGFAPIPADMSVAYDSTILMLLAFEAGGSTAASDFRRTVLRVSRHDGLTEEFFFGPGKLNHALESLRSGVDVDYVGASGGIDLKAIGYPIMRYELWNAAPEAGVDFPVHRRIYLDR